MKKVRFGRPTAPRVALVATYMVVSGRRGERGHNPSSTQISVDLLEISIKSHSDIK